MMMSLLSPSYTTLFFTTLSMWTASVSANHHLNPSGHHKKVQPRVTSAPSITHAPILARQDGQTHTCAFVGGNSNSPMTCPSPSSCTVGAQGQVQCCSAVSCTPNYYSCIPYGALVGPTRYTTDTLSCPQSAPSCVKYTYASSYPYILGCGTEAGAVTILETVDTRATGGARHALSVIAPGIAGTEDGSTSKSSGWKIGVAVACAAIILGFIVFIAIKYWPRKPPYSQRNRLLSPIELVRQQNRAPPVNSSNGHNDMSNLGNRQAAANSAAYTQPDFSYDNFNPQRGDLPRGI